MQRLVDPVGWGVGKAGGRDMYLWTFCAQFTLLLYIILFYSSINASEGDTASVSQQISANQFSGNMVLAVLAQIALIVVDRVAYLRRAHALKLAIQVVTVLAVHVMVFLAVPIVTDRTFGSNPALVVFYLLWVVYFAVSGLQLHHGFDVRPPRASLKSNGYNPPMPLLFNIYLSVPFLHELRAILDWVCTPTSLDLGQWMKVEAIHTQLFLVQSNMVGRQRGRDEWFGRKTQSPCYKFWCGTVIFVLLLLVIVGPALFFSTLNPTLTTNPVTGVALSLELRGQTTGTFPLYSTTHYESIANANNATEGGGYFSQLQLNATVSGQPTPILDSWEPLTQQMILYPFPLYTWTMAPPALANLLSLLTAAGNGSNPRTPDTSVWLDFAVAFTRGAPIGNEVITSTSSTLLDPATCATLSDIVTAAVVMPASPALTAGSLAAPGAIGPTDGATELRQVVGAPVSISSVYPLALRLPATGLPVSLGMGSRSVALTLHRISPNTTALTAGQVTGSPHSNVLRPLGAQPYSLLPLWWTLSLAADDPFAGGAAPGNASSSSTAGGLVFNLVSDKVAPSLLVSTLGGYSVLAIYVTVVLAVGRLIRSAWGSDPARIPIEELPDCTELLELCEGIRTAQRGTYTGAHVDEMHLYRVLIRLLRSPEMLIRVTAPKKEW
jgi:hypothetical protein